MSARADAEANTAAVQRDGGPASDADDPALVRSLARLARSRARLHDALLGADEGEAGARSASLLQQGLAWLRAGPLRDVARALEPWLEHAQRSLRRLWRRHPMRPSIELAGDTVQHTVVPWARAHPLAAAGCGAAAGALLVAAAPWRWPTVRAAGVHARRRAARWALRQMANPLAQAALAATLASLWAAHSGHADSPRADDSQADARSQTNARATSANTALAEASPGD